MSKVAKSGLKFVKKRVAGHKRSAEEIEEEAYERELAIQAAREAGLNSNVHPSHQTGAAVSELWECSMSRLLQRNIF
ncbi:hypothetical protein BIW11_06945 [Tropilaelaps mercedesae]|uniref:Uncharacterized protein n=1 Tax=Tropilaelaps mercedesae TaxID=418985 RepID=A0A1V9XW33_9ACAR|nr:hypothetical protein BIW11_06945 [Tropilaelaps mercedesae]